MVALKVTAFVSLGLQGFSVPELGLALMMFGYSLKGSCHGAISNFSIVWT